MINLPHGMIRVTHPPNAPGADAQVRFTCHHCNWSVGFYCPFEIVGLLRPEHLCTGQVRHSPRVPTVPVYTPEVM